jgi:hypothetical protein
MRETLTRGGNLSTARVLGECKSVRVAVSTEDVTDYRKATLLVVIAKRRHQYVGIGLSAYAAVLLSVAHPQVFREPFICK